MTRTATAVLLAVLVAASAVPTAAAAATSSAQRNAATDAQDASAYAGTHVNFDVEQNAVVDYAVGGEAVLDSVKVQSESESTGDAGGVFDGSLDLGAVTSIDGSVLSLDAKANAQAEISAEGSASMTAHDNDHGILVVAAGGDDQVVVANVSSGASAEATSDSQVEVTTANGTEGAFVVAGNGSVTVNEDGDVSARLGGDSRLVFRAYPDEKSERAEQTEEYIASGTATGEVYVEQQDGELVTDTVTYSQQTAIEAEQSAEDTVTVTVNRTRQQGKIVVTSVSEAAVGTVSNVNVTVDGEAAARASSYSELESAIGGDTSKYVVEQSASAEASAKVYVALNHFSERQVQMQGQQADDGATDGTTTEGGDATTESDDGDGGTGGGVPGFGIGVALVALVGAALYAVRQ